VNCSVAPTAKLTPVGVTAIEVIAFAVTVSVVVPLTPPTIAVIVLDPAATAVANPVAPMVAAAALELVQVAVELTFAVVPLL
jgi:hypothetical protein